MFLLEEFYHQYHGSQHRQHNTQCPVQRLCRCFISEDGCDPCEEQGAQGAQDQDLHIWHAAQVEVAGCAGEGGESHDEYAGSNCGFQFITQDGSKDEKHHHSAAGADERRHP